MNSWATLFIGLAFLFVTVKDVESNDQNACAEGMFYDSVTTNCTACPLGTYKPEVGNTSCLTCPLDGYGHQTTTMLSGSVSYDECIPVSVIMEVTPLHSPLAGGVAVVIQLSYAYVAPVLRVSLAGVNCSDIQLDDTNSTITCTSSSTDNVTYGSIGVHFMDGHNISSDLIFDYMANPVVTSLSRFDSILGGGLLIKVFGQFMTSLVNPKFEITRFFSDTTRTFQGDCLIYNDTLLACKTPGVFDDFYHPAIPSSARAKRGVEGFSFNDEFAQFYAGLSLDGVTEYRNLSNAFPQYEQITIYVDPTLDGFPTGYRDFDPSVDDTISIWGNNMDLACTVEDYAVVIGQSFCVINSLRTNHLSCAPESDSPEPTSDQGEDGEPAVVVIVGNIRFHAGYIRYANGGSLWELALGMTVGFIALIAIIVAAILLWLRRRRQHRKPQNNGLEMGPLSDPNIYSPSALSESNDGYLKPCPNLSLVPQQDPLVLQPRRMLPSVSSQAPSASSYESATSTTPLTNGSSTPRQFVSNNKHRSMSLGSVAFPRGMRAVPHLGSRSLSVTTSPPPSPGFFSVGSEFSVPRSPGSILEENGMSRHASLVTFDVMDNLAEDLGLIPEGCLVDIDRLQLQDTLGKGFFGKVYKGDLLDENGENPKTVAVKTVQGHQCSVSDIYSFLEEAVMMKDFKHPNVLPLLGVAIAATKPYVILPYMEHGDLKSYVSSSHREGITVRALLSFGVQISDGMHYLSEQKFVHRDLATRNCMINAESVVKIADFGLSRDIYQSDYYRVETKHRPLPVKWMALESLTSGVFSSKSDVWSFGVLLWELLTRGCSPYADIDTFNIKTYLQKGYRLSQPEHAPDDVFDLMKSCWLENPDDRPAFMELHLQLKEILEDRDNDVHEYLQLVYLP